MHTIESLDRAQWPKLQIHTHIAIFGGGNINSGNITESFNTTVYQSDREAKILCWLSPLEPNNRYDGVRRERFQGVGDWVLKTSEFREWRGAEEAAVRKAALFCSGNAGLCHLFEGNKEQRR